MERRPGRGSSQFPKALTLLKTELAKGEQATKELEEKARKIGVGLRSLRLAKQFLSVRAFQSVKEGKRRGPWFWSLPSSNSTTGGPVAPPITEPPAPEVPMVQIAEPAIASQPEPTPVETPTPAPEVAMASTNEEIAKMVETLQTRLDKLEQRAVSVSTVAETVKDTLEKRAADVRTSKEVEDVKKEVSALAAKIMPPDPRLAPLAEKAEVLVSLCELQPELCAHLKSPPAPTVPEVPAVPTVPKPTSPKEAHDAMLSALNEASMETLGRRPTWGDLMDMCPGGDCSKGAVEAIAKRPALLKHLVAQEGVADILIEALKENGKLVVEPEPPPGPGPEVVTSGVKSGWFGRIPRNTG